MLLHGYFAKDLLTADGYTLSARATKKQTYKMIPPTSVKNAQHEAKQHHNNNWHVTKHEDKPTSDINDEQKPDYASSVPTQ